MVQAGDRRSMELAEMIDQLGGLPMPGSVQMEEQYLAFLTLKFLLPKLADAKKLTIQRYDNVLHALTDAPAEVISLLNSHLAQHRADQAILEKAAVDILTKK